MIDPIEPECTRGHALTLEVPTDFVEEVRRQEEQDVNPFGRADRQEVNTAPECPWHPDQSAWRPLMTVGNAQLCRSDG